MRKKDFLKSAVTAAAVAVFVFVGISSSYKVVDAHAVANLATDYSLNSRDANSKDVIEKNKPIYLASNNLVDESNEQSEIMGDSPDSQPYSNDKVVESVKSVGDSRGRRKMPNAATYKQPNAAIYKQKESNENISTAKGASVTPEEITPEKTNKTAIHDSKIMEQEFSHVINIVTGSKTGTYYRFGNDIKQILSPDGIDISIQNSKGSIENINKIGSGKAIFGIVQSDVLGFLKRSSQPASRKIAEKLRMVFPFYQEELHLVANRTIEKFSDLNGKVVAVGPKGSGSWLTAVNLFKLTGIRPSKMLRLSAEKGLVAVLTNKADAMIFVAGKPVKLFKNLDSLADQEQYSYMLDNVHMIPVTDEKILKEYSASVLTSDDYKFIESPVPTVAVTAALISYDYSEKDSAYKKSRCEDVRNFSNAMYNKIDEMRASGHQKWKEVDLTAEVGLWNKDKCAKVSSISSTLEEEMLNELELNW